MLSKISYSVLFFFLFGCSPKVINFTNTASAFKDYQTYILVNFKANESRELSSEGKEIIRIIERETSQEMNRRGYEPSSRDPDLILRYEIISNQVTDVSVNPGYPYSYYYPSVSTRTFLQSAILLELTDRKTKKLVWQASVDMNRYSKKERKEEIIHHAITNLFNTFLYKAGGSTPDESLIEK